MAPGWLSVEITSPSRLTSMVPSRSTNSVLSLPPSGISTDPAGNCCILIELPTPSDMMLGPLDANPCSVAHFLGGGNVVQPRECWQQTPRQGRRKKAAPEGAVFTTREAALIPDPHHHVAAGVDHGGAVVDVDVGIGVVARQRAELDAAVELVAGHHVIIDGDRGRGVVAGVIHRLLRHVIARRLHDG